MFFGIEEAKEKWCPFAMVVLPEREGTVNRSARTGKATSGTHCLATQCMMWCMLGDGSENGYCGLARVPERMIEAFAKE